MTTTIFYPSFDSYVFFNDGGSSSFATARSAANATNTDSTSSNYEPYCRNNTSAIGRTIEIFDTSTLGDSDVISSAIFAIMPFSLTGNGEALTIQGCTPATDTSVTASDYSSYSALNSPTLYSDTPINGSSSTVDVYFEKTLNSSGRSAISLTGKTRFMLRDVHDTENTASGTTFYNYRYYSRNQTGTSKDPYLSVTVTSGPANIKSVDGVALASIKSVDGVVAASIKNIDGIA